MCTLLYRTPGVGAPRAARNIIYARKEPSMLGTYSGPAFFTIHNSHTQYTYCVLGHDFTRAPPLGKAAPVSTSTCT